MWGYYQKLLSLSFKSAYAKSQVGVWEQGRDELARAVVGGLSPIEINKLPEYQAMMRLVDGDQPSRSMREAAELMLVWQGMASVEASRTAHSWGNGAAERVRRLVAMGRDEERRAMLAEWLREAA
jgi:hypothetical protein